LPPASSSSAAPARPTPPTPPAASSSPPSSANCPTPCAISKRATSPRWTSRRPRSAPAWPSSPATPRSSTRRARRSPCARRCRWALAWFEQHGFAEGEYGVAETLSKAKNTSVSGLAEAGILESKRGKVRLLAPDELPADWDPATDPRLTAWETVHHLIRALTSGGESAAAGLVAQLGARAETARELAYRLYTLCERKKRAADALAYNGLVQSWPELVRLAKERPEAEAKLEQGELL
jgi:adenine-specific DNA methylase